MDAGSRRSDATLRARNVEALGGTFDVLVVGGGINGAATAAALSARGAKVALIDARDFAGLTSQQSSNLVWGGIKYMESYEFALVADLCKSRNELMRSFPSTVKEIRFLTTVSKGFRHHPLTLWAGAWLYWLFGRGHTRIPAYLAAGGIAAKEPIINTSNCRGGIEYSDAYLPDNDARFVFSFVRHALDHGCTAANYVESTATSRGEDGLWTTLARDTIGGGSMEIRSRVLVNATGAYVDHHNSLAGIRTEHRHVLSKGIHLVVPRVSAEKRVLAFFADDGRLFFAIPMANRTCIGTTDTRVTQPQTAVTDEDREFVLSNINARLNLPSPLTHKDVIAERCGVRPLAVRRGADAKTDFLQLSRKHVVEVDAAMAHVSIFGGKLTDCVNIGEELCKHVAELGVPLSCAERRWYGEPDAGVRQAYERRAGALGLDALKSKDTDESLTDRLWRRYGTHAEQMLDAIEADETLVEPVIDGTGLRRCELDYLAEHEMIIKLEDLLRRRSKLALVFDRAQLMASPGVYALCRALFGDAAQARFDEYFGKESLPPDSRELRVGHRANA